MRDIGVTGVQTCALPIWPFVEGRGDDERFRNPFVTWRTEDASPSGLAYARGSLWAGALNGERLWQVPVAASGTGKPRGWFVGDYGRMRTGVVAPNGNLWVTTSSRDGRGDPAPQDDRILEIALPLPRPVEPPLVTCRAALRDVSSRPW